MKFITMSWGFDFSMLCWKCVVFLLKLQDNEWKELIIYLDNCIKEQNLLLLKIEVCLLSCNAYTFVCIMSQYFFLIPSTYWSLVLFHPVQKVRFIQPAPYVFLVSSTHWIYTKKKTICSCLHSNLYMVASESSKNHFIPEK
jgi:hypothetical protein